MYAVVLLHAAIPVQLPELVGELAGLLVVVVGLPELVVGLELGVPAHALTDGF